MAENCDGSQNVIVARDPKENTRFCFFSELVLAIVVNGCGSKERHGVLILLEIFKLRRGQKSSCRSGI